MKEADRIYAELVEDMKKEVPYDAQVFFNLFKTEYLLRKGEIAGAKRLNDMLFLDKYSEIIQYNMLLLYEHRFRILLTDKDYEGIEKLYNSRVTQKQLDKILEHKRINLIPEFIHAISMWHLDVTQQEKTIEKLLGMIESNLDEPFFRKYRMLKDGIGFVLEHLPRLKVVNKKRFQEYDMQIRGVMDGAALNVEGG